MKVRTKSMRSRTVSQDKARGRRTLAEFLESRVLLSTTALTTSPTGYQMVDLGDFNDSTNGFIPQAGVIRDSTGNLYGTTAHGGSHHDGTVFELAAGSSTIITLASFNGTNGSTPVTSLVMDSSGNLYGTAEVGGANNHGTVFEVAAGSSSITVIASFNGTNGSVPISGLVMDSSGNLFGSTVTGGANGDGTLFEIAAGTSTISVVAPYTSPGGSYADLLIDSTGDLFGTTFEGGTQGDGSIFEVAAGTSTITTLASFDSTTGNQPRNTMAMDSSGNLYGMTAGGGDNDDGTVFELPAGGSTIHVIASLSSSTGIIPQQNGLIVDSRGNLFGTTDAGGPGNNGTVFEIPAGTSTIVVIASPSGDFEPVDDVIATDSSGDLYLTSQVGGANGDGNVFEIVAPPAATQAVIVSQPTTATAGDGQTFQVSLESGSGQVIDDSSTVTLSIASGPNGATLGGTLSAADTNGVATFSGITFSEAGTYTLTASATGLTSATSTIITVSASSAATLAFVSQPGAALAGQTIGTVIVDVEDAFGNVVTTDNSTVTLATSDAAPLTGTTMVTAINGVATFTGLSSSQPGDHRLVATDGSLNSATSNAFAVLTPYVIAAQANFNSATGQEPSGGVVSDSLGNLYGVTTYGGNNDNGTVFEIPAGASTVTTLALFDGIDGSHPSGLIIDSSGNLFGSASDGGANDDGTVYEIAAGTNTITTLASFDGTDGQRPESGMVMDSHGNLFGTTLTAGSTYGGTVFEVAANSNAVTLIATFSTPIGTNPSGGVVMDSAGNLYGVTYQGGIHGYGSVYEVAANSNTITPLAFFDSTTGKYPYGGVMMDSTGNLYGTTLDGGDNSNGTVFELAAGSGTITPLASLDTSVTGNYPNTSLVIDSTGNLYGTTSQGGAENNGTFFEVAAGSGEAIPLASFTSDIGSGADGNIYVASNGDFFGTARFGNTVFAASPAPTQAVITTQLPNTFAAGSSQSISVSLETAGGQLTVASSPVTLSIASGPNGASIGGTVTVPVFDGVADFSGLTFDTAGTYTLTASADGVTSATTSAFTVVPAAAEQLAIVQQPSAVAVAGQMIGTIVVGIDDIYGNLVTSDSSTVSLSSSNTLKGTTAVQAVDGVATFTGLSMTRADPDTLTASDAALAPATTGYVVVTPAAAVKLVFVQQPSTLATAGQPLGTIEVDVEDRYGNIVIGDASNVTITAEPAGIVATAAALKGTTTMTAQNGAALFSDLAITAAGTYTLAATDAALTPASSPQVTVAAIAGQNVSPIVIDPATAFPGSSVKSKRLHLRVASELSGGRIVLGRSIPVKHGLAVLNHLNLHKAGIYSLLLSDAAGHVTTEQITVVAGAAVRLVFGGKVTASNGYAATTVQVADRYGNLTNTADGETVDLSTAPHPLGAGSDPNQSGALTAAIVDGVATFANFPVGHIHRGRLIATSGTLRSARSNVFQNI